MAAVGGGSKVILKLCNPFQLFLAGNKKLFYWFKQHAFVIFKKYSMRLCCPIFFVCFSIYLCLKWVL